MPLPPRYKVSSDLNGIGGMSDVLVCDDVVLDRKVVVKALKPGIDPSRLLDELQALQHIRSDYVVQVFDIIPDGTGKPQAIVEEYIPGSGLEHLVANIDSQKFTELGYQISSGLAEVHGHGIVHRDLKPDNCKFDNHGYLKIFDFGLARFSGLNASTMNIAGTPGFMAPELFQPNPSGAVVFDSAIDIFAFGAVMFYLLAGRLPSGVRKMPPVLPCADLDFSHFGSIVPPNLISTLNRCFATLAVDRPSAGEIKDRFQELLLYGKHKALMHSSSGTYNLSMTDPKAAISVPGLGSLIVEYDGYYFYATNVSGNVFINNKTVANGERLPPASVIVLGAPELKFDRVQLTFDISHPAVIL